MIEMRSQPKRSIGVTAAVLARLSLKPARLTRKAGNDPVDHLQQRREQVRLGGEQKAQWNRQREHPLAHRDARDDAVDQMGGGFRHAPRTARGAKATPLA